MGISKVFAVTMVKDEEDILAYTLSHLQKQELDGIIVADNNSSDSSRRIIERSGVELIDDPEVGYYQSTKMTHLAYLASLKPRGLLEPCWILPFDADELWYVEDGRTIGAYLRELDSKAIAVNLFNHFRSLSDPGLPNPFWNILWRQQEPSGLCKVAFQYWPGVFIQMGNHGLLDCTDPKQLLSVILDPSLLNIRHFPYRSEKQFISKSRNGAAAYKATNLEENVGAHWRMYGHMIEQCGEQSGADWFRKHFLYTDPLAAGMVMDPAPYRGILC